MVATALRSSRRRDFLRLRLERRERVEPDGRAAQSDAIAEAVRQAIGDDDAQRLAGARNVGKLRDKLADIQHARMSC
jgi:hypothetical protein